MRYNLTKEELRHECIGLFCKAMIGRYCHSWKDGDIQYQGRVERVDSSGFQIQLFSFVMGEKTHVITVPVREFIEQWTYYPDGYAMNWALDMHNLKQTIKGVPNAAVNEAYADNIEDRLMGRDLMFGESTYYPPHDKRDKRKPSKAA
ncbi:hypothetical protein [Aestuariivirga sp.]|uniref:hypothetical protein n=1 Tax=Aestuariivirga sp. TaxID=2650926 RepID=UPI0035939AEB